MPPSKQIVALLVFAGLSVSMIGCGGGGSSAPAPRNQIELKNIHEMYGYFVKRYEKPPADMTEFPLDEFEGIHPFTVKSLRDEKFVVVWNIKAKDAGTVLAFEKDTPTQGGGVVMADGTVKTMTAAEFASAKRAP